jgi:hypothetical protein
MWDECSHATHPRTPGDRGYRVSRATHSTC